MIDGPDGKDGQSQTNPPADGSKDPASTLLGDKGKQDPPASDPPPKDGEKPKGGDDGTGKKDGESPEGQTPQRKAPENYQLALPENAVIDKAILDETATIARELDLSNEDAQKMVNFLNTQNTARDAAILESNRPGGAEWKARTTEWAQQALKDNVIGGSPEKLQESVNLAKRALTEFFPPEVSEFLEETGFGSNPALLRGLAKIGKTMAEGDIHQPDTRSHGKTAPQDVLFDKTVEKK